MTFFPHLRLVLMLNWPEFLSCVIFKILFYNKCLKRVQIREISHLFYKHKIIFLIHFCYLCVQFVIFMLCLAIMEMGSTVTDVTWTCEVK